jgi:hypothetical protein
MDKTARNALILWLATALSIVVFVAGFNFGVDPFGYFGRNTIGYYFSSERQFKYVIIKNYDYNAIVFGDSRIAYADTSKINYPEYSFVNGGVAGSSVAEQVALMSGSRLDRLRLVVFGLQFGDLAHCSEDDETPTGVVTAPREFGPWDALRFAASWTQFAYALEAVMARARGQSPEYHPDGSRTVVSKHFEESVLDAKTPRYWDKIERDIPQEPKDGPKYELGYKCRQLLSEARRLADRHGFALIVVFLPMNSDLLMRLNWDTPEAHKQLTQFLAQVEDVVPHVVDLSSSSFSDSRNFWLDDSMHFKPLTGAQIVEEAIKRSIGAQARR